MSLTATFTARVRDAVLSGTYKPNDRMGVAGMIALASTKKDSRLGEELVRHLGLVIITDKGDVTTDEGKALVKDARTLFNGIQCFESPIFVHLKNFGSASEVLGEIKHALSVEGV